MANRISFELAALARRQVQHHLWRQPPLTTDVDGLDVSRDVAAVHDSPPYEPPLTVIRKRFGFVTLGA